MLFVALLYFYFIFSQVHTFLEYLVIVNFILLCKLSFAYIYIRDVNCKPYFMYINLQDHFHCKSSEQKLVKWKEAVISFLDFSQGTVFYKLLRKSKLKDLERCSHLLFVYIRNLYLFVKTTVFCDIFVTLFLIVLPRVKRWTQLQPIIRFFKEGLLYHFLGKGPVMFHLFIFPFSFVF